MEYQKIINSINNTAIQKFKFMIKSFGWNTNTPGRHNTNSQIRFKTSMPKSSWCDYSDAYIMFKEL